jgi:hypothetical protein
MACLGYVVVNSVRTGDSRDNDGDDDDNNDNNILFSVPLPFWLKSDNHSLLCFG